MSLSDLRKRFNFPDVIQFEQQGDLIKCLVKAKYADAEFFLQGAHITSFVPKHSAREILWLSSQSNFTQGKAIRGGVPICWPWFGQPKVDQSQSNQAQSGQAQSSHALPQHGFARNSEFDLNSIEISNESVVIKLNLISSQETLKIWPHHFKLAVELHIGKQLQIRLTTVNNDSLPFSISEAIHSYFSVRDINTTRIDGLNDISFFDQLTGQSDTQLGSQEFSQEVDKIYAMSGTPLKIVEQDKTQVVLIQENANSTVVWNPWISKARSMADFPDSGYLNMLCVEAANTGKEISIAPGEQHTITQIIEGL